MTTVESPLIERARVLAHRGDFTQAESVYLNVLTATPGNASVNHELGLVRERLGTLEAAATALRHAIALDTTIAQYHYDLGRVLGKLGDVDGAESSFRMAVKLRPDVAAAHYDLGLILQQQGDLTVAAQEYDEAIRLAPGLVEARNNRGIVTRLQGDAAGSLPHFYGALELRPDFGEAHANLATALNILGRAGEAMHHHQEAARLLPTSAVARNNVASALWEQGLHEAAIREFREALRLAPEYAEAHNNLGLVLQSIGDRAGALRSFASAVELAPTSLELLNNLVHESQYTCTWDNLDADISRLKEAFFHKQGLVPPFSILTIDSSPQEQLDRAKVWVDGRLKPVEAVRSPLGFEFDARPKSRLRIGYLSSDFQEHAIGHLIPELLELHDRNCFEILGYSSGEDEGTDIRRRIERAFDRFVDIRHMSAEEAARGIFADRIDILVDLNGHTKGGRTQIDALRPAPIQVSYLGYPGTMGAHFIDYVITDRYLTPPHLQEFYTEIFCYLPDTYQPSDRSRPILSEVPTRSAVGLPDEGIVFSCLSNPYKISPRIFDVWMRFLSEARGSVLWLQHQNSVAVDNLRGEASKRGIEPDRLVFAPRAIPPVYRVTLPLIDLFLDTFPYNAGAVANDVLFAGVPILTCSGETYVSRMAGSLLRTLGVSELVTESLEEYEALGSRLIREPHELRRLRSAVATSRETSALFDTPRYVRNLEDAYRGMWESFVQSSQGPKPKASGVPFENARARRAARRREEREAGRRSPGTSSKLELTGLMQQAGELMRRGLTADAEASLMRATRIDPHFHPAWSDLAGIHAASGRFELAQDELKQAIEAEPNLAQYHSDLANILWRLERNHEAAASCRRALEIDPNHFGALNNLGLVLLALGHHQQAAAVLRRALELHQNMVGYCNLGIVLSDCGQLEEAVSALEKAIALQPDSAEAHYQLGRAFQKQGHLDLAAREHETALQLDPKHVQSHNGLGVILQTMGHLPAALDQYRQAARLDDKDPQVLNNLAHALFLSHQVEPALWCLEEVLRLDPKFVGAHNNLALISLQNGDLAEALMHLRSEMALVPDSIPAIANLIRSLQEACEWQEAGILGERLRQLLDLGSDVAVPPYVFLTLGSSPREQLIRAKAWVADTVRPIEQMRRQMDFRCERTPKDTLKIGFISSDFREHAVAYLLVEVLELHDRDHFELTGYDIGVNDGSEFKMRLQAAFDRFVDVSSLSAEEAARLIYSDGIDILVDLNGHTKGGRTHIVALQPAPIQVSFLGYPATMGADFIDYVITDRFLTPPEQQEFYTERFAYMPDVYQPGDRRRPFDASLTRASCGLPDGAFVFCCFNNSYKITPAMFDVWMRLLRETPNSVLWLQHANDLAVVNLTREASMRGLDPARLIFAPRADPEQYRGRLPLADLFLDTVPYNAGAVANDVLWAGLPMVTCAGDTYVSRMAGSLLHSVGLPQLVTSSVTEYADVTLRLARDRDELLAHRRRLVEARETSPLFDTSRYTRNLENLFRHVWDSALRQAGD